MARKTKAKVCIIESVGFLEEQSHKEGEIISRTLRLAGKTSAYIYVRNKKELAAAIQDFGKSSFRYLHLSCHGNEGEFWTTLDSLSDKDLAKIIAPHVNGRRVFISSCLAANQKNKFARHLLRNSKCLSVVAPTQIINLSDAAIFWTAFYHLMFKDNKDRMGRQNIEKNLHKCSRLIDEEFRYYFRDEGAIRSKLF